MNGMMSISDVEQDAKGVYDGQEVYDVDEGYNGNVEKDMNEEYDEYDEYAEYDEVDACDTHDVHEAQVEYEVYGGEGELRKV